MISQESGCFLCTNSQDTVHFHMIRTVCCLFGRQITLALASSRDQCQLALMGVYILFYMTHNRIVCYKLPQCSLFHTEAQQ